MKLITEEIKSKLLEEQSNFGWDKYTHNLINDLIELCNELKSQELQSIEKAFRTGYHTEDRWALDLEIYDFIRSNYNEDIMTYEEFEKAKKQVEFFKKNFANEGGNDE